MVTKAYLIALEKLENILFCDSLLIFGAYIFDGITNLMYDTKLYGTYLMELRI